MKKVILLTILLAQLVFAKSIFIEPSGEPSSKASGSGNGLISSPFDSIQNGIDIANDGDTIFLRQGNYHETVTITKQYNSPIVITGYKSERVVIDGTTTINPNWHSTSHNNVYSTIINENIWQLFKNNKEQVIARWPNASFEDESIFSLSTWQHPNNSATETNGTVNDTDLLELQGKNIVGAMAILNTGSFRTYSRKILTQTNESFTYTPTSASGYKNKHHNYFIEGSIDLIDTIGEWYYDSLSKELYVYAENKSNLDNSIFRGKTQTYAFNISNASNVIITNLKFFATTFYISKSKNITIEKCHFAFPNTNRRIFKSESAPLVTTVMNNKNEPASNIRIADNLFENTDGEGLVAKATGLILENNTFHHIDWSCGSTQGLGLTINMSSCLSAKILKNTIYTAGASSTISPGNKSKIMYNKIWDTGRLQGDGSVVQCTNSQVENSEIAFNLIFDTPKYALRYDAPANDPTVAGTNGLMHNNIAYNTHGIIIKGNNHHIFNNTVFNSTSNDMIILTEDSSNTTTKIFNNLVQKMAGHRSGNLNSYPLPTPFVYTNWNGYEKNGANVTDLLKNWTNNDFTPNSLELIDMGTVIDGYPSTFAGTKPDIGAIEKNGQQWATGSNTSFQPFPWTNSTTITKSIPSIINSSILWPNPANNYVNLKKDFKWTLVDSKGKFIKKGIGNKINLLGLEGGLYNILIDGKYYTFIKCN